MRFEEATAKIANAHLVCMIDTWPSTAATHYAGYKPLSTVSRAIHFTSNVTKINPESHIGYHAMVNFAEDGNLLAHSTQTNIIYA